MTNTQVDHVPRATFFWVIGVMVSVQIAANGFIFSSIDERINRVEQRVEKVENQVQDINTDIRLILIGIEQVKARMGIIEAE